MFSNYPGMTLLVLREKKSIAKKISGLYSLYVTGEKKKWKRDFRNNSECLAMLQAIFHKFSCLPYLEIELDTPFGYYLTEFSFE